MRPRPESVLPLRPAGRSASTVPPGSGAREIGTGPVGRLGPLGSGWASWHDLVMSAQTPDTDRRISALLALSLTVVALLVLVWLVIEARRGSVLVMLIAEALAVGAAWVAVSRSGWRRWLAIAVVVGAQVVVLIVIDGNGQVLKLLGFLALWPIIALLARYALRVDPRHPGGDAHRRHLGRPPVAADVDHEPVVGGRQGRQVRPRERGRETGYHAGGARKRRRHRAARPGRRGARCRRARCGRRRRDPGADRRHRRRARSTVRLHPSRHEEPLRPRPGTGPRRRRRVAGCVR